MIEILIIGMATWRLSSILVNEDGPKYWMKDFRQWAGISYDSFGRMEAVKETLLAGILSCLWCCSVWVGGGFAIAYYFSPLITLKIATALSFSTVAIVIESMLVRRE